MRLILVRHGETEENAAGISHGYLPGTLSAKGKEQAKSVGVRLKKEHIDAIYYSDLKRAADTAMEIAKHHAEARLVFDERLREQNFGIYEGSPRGTLNKVVDEKGVSFREHKFEGGESVLEMRARFMSLLVEVIKNEKGKTVLFVSHGGPIANLFLHLLALPNKQFSQYAPKNTAVSVVDFNNPEKPVIVLLNDTSHLS